VHLKINKDTQLCMSLAARPGNFGTRFQNFLFDRLDLNFVYKAFTTQDLPGAVTSIRALGVRGCAISMPFKESVIELLDELDDSARGIQSVNTILNTGGVLRGSNTDYIAVAQLLRKSGISPASSFALFGSGGMAKAVACALKDLGFRNGVIVARNQKTGSALAAQYGFSCSPVLNGSASLLINASPIGMAGGKESEQNPFTAEQVKSADSIFEVVALPVETPLYQMAAGKKRISGADVMVLQAVEQFVLYTGIRPEAALIQEAAAFANSQK
jgi:shikimate dehydrogenase